MMSNDKTDDADATPKKKTGSATVKILAVVVLLGVGGGTAYGLMLSGMIGHATETKHDNKPQLVRKGQEDPYAPKAEAGNEDAAGEEIEGEGGEPYRTSYYTFAEEFTSNLRGSGHFVQLSLAASTNYDGRVLMWIKKHELAI